MNVIISANEKILAITQNKDLNLTERMSEEEYINWIKNMVKVGTNDGTNFQGVEI